MRRRDALRVIAGAATAGVARGTGTPASGSYGPLGRLDVEGAKEAVAGDDGTVYLATTDGFAVVDVEDPARPRLLAERRDLLADREDGPLRDIQDVKVDGDRLLVVGPAHGGPALRAALFYDVGDPADPEPLGVHETTYPVHNAFLDGERAYLTGNDGEANPLVIVDPDGELGRWSLLDRDPGWIEAPAALRPLHDVWVHDGTAHLAYWDAGTWIVDVRDPASPSYLGRVGGRSRRNLASIEEIGRAATELPGNHHYAATDETGDLLAVGKEAWARGDDGTGGPGGIDLWDVSTPSDSDRLATIDPPPTADPSYGGTWTTAHNFDLHGGRLYSAWYQGGVKIHDVSDPDQPRELAWWRRPEEARFWTAIRAGGVVAASSMGTADVPARLYTFPDRPGEQTDPATRSPAGAGPGETNGSHGSGSGDSTGTPARGDETATTGQGGFGALAALAALGAYAWRRR